MFVHVLVSSPGQKQMCVCACVSDFSGAVIKHHSQKQVQEETV